MNNLNKVMINKFKDMADCADAAYAKLDFVFEKIDSNYYLFAFFITLQVLL